jgi:hypothetical protein
LGSDNGSFILLGYNLLLLASLCSADREHEFINSFRFLYKKLIQSNSTYVDFTGLLFGAFNSFFLFSLVPYFTTIVFVAETFVVNNEVIVSECFLLSLVFLGIDLFEYIVHFSDLEKVVKLNLFTYLVLVGSLLASSSGFSKLSESILLGVVHTRTLDDTS